MVYLEVLPTNLKQPESERRCRMRENKVYLYLRSEEKEGLPKDKACSISPLQGLGALLPVWFLLEPRDPTGKNQPSSDT